MKSSTQKSSKSPQKFNPAEYIRVAPLHHPKPNLSVDELNQARESEGSDLFDGKTHTAPANAKLTYRNGPLLTGAQVYTIFWGKLWGSTPTSATMMTQLNQFFAAIIVSPLIDQLSEYNVSGQAIGHGAFIGTKIIRTNAPTKSITDSAVQSQLKAWIAAKTVPKNGANTLYFIYLDPGVVSIMGGSRSCQSYCGYHNSAGSIYYAVMPYPSCSGCLGGMAPLDALTGTSSHELCEAITDPVPGTGWYDDNNGEIGDICAWNFKNVAGFNVQLEWSNKQKKCV